MCATLPHALLDVLGAPPPNSAPGISLLLNHGRATTISPEDEPRVRTLNWHARFNKRSNSWFARHSTTARVDGKPKAVTTILHRFILDVSDPALCVVHLNHETLDNRRSNLRVLSREDFHRFVAVRADPERLGGIKGVSFRNNRWEAYVSLRRKQYYLGVFRSAVDAALAYNLKAREFYGPHAFLNDVIDLARKSETDLMDMLIKRPKRGPQKSVRA